jgi:hypothetical protein
VDARLAGPCHARPVVVEEHHLRRLGPQPLAGERVDRGIGLAHPALVGVDDLVDQVLEAVGGLFPLPGADEAVAHDPRAISRPEAADVLDQLGVGGAKVLPPDHPHELFKLPLIEAKAFPDRLVHVALAYRPDGTVLPDVLHALIDFAWLQAKPGLPHFRHPERGSDLQHAADVEHNRFDGHTRMMPITPRSRSRCDCRVFTD